MMQNQLLVQRLDEFIRKYYKNQLIKGLILFVGLFTLATLVVLTLEYFGRYGTLVRTILFYSLLGASIYLAWRFLYKPIKGLLHIGPTLNHEQAAAIIGVHFNDISDKLLNMLQLQKQARSGNALIEAAIRQKIETLSPIPFAQAIDLRKNLQYLPYGATPILLVLLIALFAPDFIKDTPSRLIRYNTFFPAPAPFQYIVLNDSLVANQQEDFELRVKISGNKLPDDVKLLVDGNTYLMQKIDKINYAYTFRNVRSDAVFQFIAADYPSQKYTLQVRNRPQLQQWALRLVYPAYTGKKMELLANPGDLLVPFGTSATWTLTTTHAQQVQFKLGEKRLQADMQKIGVFTLQQQLRESVLYQVLLSNPENGTADSMAYRIQIIADEYPRIDVAERFDSINNKQYYFAGEIGDDYGLTRLTFNYTFETSKTADKKGKTASVNIAVPKGEKQHRFYHDFNLNQIGIEPGDEVSFYFEVWDNDGVRGAKSSRSPVMLHKAPTIDEMKAQSDKASKDLIKEMENAIKEAQKLQQEMKQLDRKMAEKKELTWEEKKKLEEMLARQKQLQQQIEKIKEQQQQQVKQEAEYNRLSDELMQKQEMIDKLFNELMNEELKQLIRQTQQMLQMQNKDLIKQEMEKLQLNNKDIEKELDRMLEQFKEMEVEKKLDEAINKLDELQQKQQDLADKTKQLEQDKKLGKEEKQQQLDKIKNEQEQLKKEFDEWQKKADELREQNKQLEQPKQIEDTKDQEQQIEQNMEQGAQEIDSGKPEKASQKQQKAAEQMKEMADNMKKERQQQEQEQDELDAEALREILENIIQLSKDQENLMEKMNKITGYSPQFVEAGKEQKVISDNAKIIEDSLLALSKRVPQISSFVNKEVSKMKDNLDRSVQAYSQRSMGEIRVRQQYAMASANNLGVMLSEVLQQMQAEMNAKQGSQKGQGKPGKGQGSSGSGKSKRSMGELKKMQEELNKQLREGMNKQQNGGSQQGPGSKEFARMAAQQQAIRQMMQQMMNQMGGKEKEGMGGAKQLQEMQRLMEQTEKELFNKKLSSEMLQRQQEIMTRMLESEKAEKQREQDQKRQGEQAKEKQQAAPPDFSPYFKQKEKETELIQTIPTELKPYYKERAKTYFNKIAAE
jgi:hypothetical protein